MVEYILLILAVFSGAAIAEWCGINAAWIVLPIVVLTLPSVYAMMTGSPFLPTDKTTLKQMLALARIQPGETVVDLGCGDGRLVRAAAQQGAHAIGYELSLFLYCLARIRGGAVILYQSYWKADVTGVDVVFLYIEKRFLGRFEREIWPQLKPGCRVIANTFPLPTIAPVHSQGHVYVYEKG